MVVGLRQAEADEEAQELAQDEADLAKNAAPGGAAGTASAEPEEEGASLLEQTSKAAVSEAAPLGSARLAAAAPVALAGGALPAPSLSPLLRPSRLSPPADARKKHAARLSSCCGTLPCLSEPSVSPVS